MCEDLPDYNMLETQLHELENSLWHLKRSNHEIQQFLLEDPQDKVNKNQSFHHDFVF